MSYSETITRTDLTNILNQVLTASSGMSVEDISDKITFGSAWTGSHKKAYLIGGKFVFFTLEGYAGTIVAGTQYTIATIASGYRPKDTVPFTGHATNISYVPQSVVNCYVWTGGEITVRCSNANGNYIFINGWYALAEGSAPITVADYIVEEGTSGIWAYRKWANGTLELWGQTSESWTMNNPIGSLYYGMKNYDISSFGFTAIDNIQVSGQAAGYYMCAKIETYNLSTISITSFAAVSDVRTVEHNIYVFGYWK